MNTGIAGLRWGRGFFRLWVVVSIAWAIAIAFLTYESFPPTDAPWLRADIDGASLSRSEIEAAKQEAWNASKADVAARYQAFLDTLDAEIRDRRFNAAMNGFLALISLPAALLIGGLLIRWILIGFRPSPKPPAQ